MNLGVSLEGDPRAETVDLLGVRLRLPASVRRFAPELADLLAGDGRAPRIELDLDTGLDAGLDPGLDTGPDPGPDPGPGSGGAAATASLGEVLARLTEAVVRNSPMLCVHAAVVAGPRGSLVVPGHSGLGKTTLTAALIQAGFSYLSDEVLAIDRTTGEVAGFPRPLSLAPDVWPLLGLTEPAVAGEAERQFQPGRFGAVASPGPPGHRVSDIVLARRRAEPGTELRPGSPTEAVTALLTRAFNHYLDPQGSLTTAARVVRDAAIWQADYHDAPELAARLWQLGQVSDAK